MNNPTKPTYFIGVDMRSCHKALATVVNVDKEILDQPCKLSIPLSILVCNLPFRICSCKKASL